MKARNHGGSEGLMLKESPNPIPELAEEFEVSENFMMKRFLFRCMNKIK
jgi:hypothetical protein